MIPETTASSGTLPTTSSATRRSIDLSSDFETFLSMLTAQARYQDPLEPIDSTEYAAQLAQFSMVEQQVQTNETLSALLASLGPGNAASLAAWVGMEARAVAPAYFDGNPVTVAPAPVAGADQADLVVRNADGIEVQRLPIAPTAEPVQWSGRTGDGAPLASGFYSFEVESRNNSTVIRTEPAEIYARVTEAQVHGSEIVLVLDGGQSVPSGSVTALRDG